MSRKRSSSPPLGPPEFERRLVATLTSRQMEAYLRRGHHERSIAVLGLLNRLARWLKSLFPSGERIDMPPGKRSRSLR